MSAFTVTTTCYCGSVRLGTTAAAPIGGGFCSCKSCRRAHGAALYSVAYVPAETVTVISGAELLKSWSNRGADPEATRRSGQGRFFCSQCGTRTHITLLIRDRLLTGLHRGGFDSDELAASATWSPQSGFCFYRDEQPFPLLADALAPIPSPPQPPQHWTDPPQ